MDNWKPVPLPDGSYKDDCRPFSVQDLVGYLPVNAEVGNTRSPTLLKSCPGLQEFANVNGARRDRGGYVAEGRLLFVKDTTLYQLMPNGSKRAIGTVPGSGRVNFTHNKVGSNIEVFIASGPYGGIYSSDADTLTQITDDAFLGAKAVGYVGHLFLAVDPSGRSFRNSALNDGSNWNGLEFYEGESKPDRIVGIPQYAANGEIPVFSERSIEHFSYTGETNALFQRIPGTTLDRGCAATNAISSLDNALFFIGDDGNGYEKRGYQLKRITTHPIEQDWARCDLAKAYSFTWEDNGHKVWYVTFPDGKTWGYDVATSKWHRRKSYGMDRWRLAWLQKWNGYWYGGEFNSGRIFRLDSLYAGLEGRDELERLTSSGVLHDNGNRLNLHGLRIAYDAAGADTVPGPVLPLAFDLDQRVVDGITFGGTFPDLAVGDTVDFWYTTLGGSGEVTFAINGALPAGLSFNGGHVTGTCTTAEHDNEWEVVAGDEAGGTATLVETSYVMDMLGDPPDVFADEAYSYALTGSEGTAPYTFAKTAGSLPVGIALASDGTFSGTADSTPATSNFSVTMTDAAGVTQTKPYSVQIKDATAANLLPDIDHWWPLDTSLADVVGSANLSSPVGSGITYQNSTKTQEAKVGGNHVAGIATTNGVNRCFWAIINPVGTGASNRLMFGFANNVLGSGDYFQNIQITDSGTKATLYINSYSQTKSVQGTITPGTKFLACVNIDDTAKTAELFIDGVSAGTTAVIDDVIDCAYFGIRANSATDTVGEVDFIDEVACILSRKLTAGEIAYLYNSGNFKSYAEVVADAAP